MRPHWYNYLHGLLAVACSEDAAEYASKLPADIWPEPFRSMVCVLLTGRGYVPETPESLELMWWIETVDPSVWDRKEVALSALQWITQ